VVSEDLVTWLRAQLVIYDERRVLALCHTRGVTGWREEWRP